MCSALKGGGPNIGGGGGNIGGGGGLRVMVPKRLKSEVRQPIW